MRVPKSDYLLLMERYLRGEIDAKSLNEQFLPLWRQDRDDEDMLRRSWPRRYDIELQHMLANGEISREEFGRRFRDLCQYSPADWEAEDIIGQAFVSLDYWCDNEDGSAPSTEVAEQHLREDLTSLSLRLRRILEAE